MREEERKGGRQEESEGKSEGVKAKETKRERKLMHKIKKDRREREREGRKKGERERIKKRERMQ